MTWVSNETLSLAADELADVMLSMLSVAGIPVDKIGLPDKDDVTVFKQGFLVDAMDYMAFDPARLEEEYNDILSASRFFVEHPDAKPLMGTANAEIAANWTGTASDEFANQMERIVNFMDHQETYMWYAAQAVSMMYGIAVQFRATFHDLVVKSTAVCRALLAKAPIPTLDWDIILMEAAGAAIDLVTLQTPKELAKWAITKLLDAIKGQMKDDSVEAADELAALNDYTDARDRLKRSYEANLDLVRKWIDDRTKDLEAVAIPMKLPMAVGADVDSPQFTYDDFYYSLHDPNVYAPEVERERTKYVEEKGNGLIAERLRGEG